MQFVMEGAQFASICRGPDKIVNLLKFGARPLTMSYDILKGTSQTVSIIAKIGRAAMKGEIGLAERALLASGAKYGAIVAVGIFISVL